MTHDTTKTCTKCGIAKPLNEFYRRKSPRDGLQSQCRKCMCQASAAYRVANAEKIAVRKREYRAKNSKRRAAYNRLHTYGISKEQYDEILEKQEGGCAICGDVFGDITPQIDHCHTSKQVRGLLCHKCNVGIGMLRDNADICRSAATYLAQSAMEG